MRKSKRIRTSVRFWVIVSVVLFLPIAMLMLFRAGLQSEFDRRVDALRAQGFPVSIDDLKERYTIPEGIENAADIYMLAFKHQQRPTPTEQPWLPWIGSYKNSEDEPPYPQKVIDTIGPYLQRNKTTLELLDQAVQTENCLWPRIDKGLWLFNDHLGETKRTIELLNLQNLYLAQAGNTDELFNSMLTTIGVSKSISKQLLLIDHLVGISMKAICASSLENVLGQVQFTEDQLQMLQNHFTSLQDTKAHYRTLVNGRCDTIAFWKLPTSEQIQSLGTFRQPSKPAHILYSASSIKQKDALLSLDYMEKNIAAAQLPVHKRIEAFEKNLNEMNTGFMSFMHLYLNVTLAPPAVMKLDLRLIANLKCAETALAIERYRLKHGTVPDSIIDLVPRFMAEIPRDPFDNKTLRYIKLENGFTVYSISDDLIDNGGISRSQARKIDRNNQQYDWPFTVKWKYTEH